MISRIIFAFCLCLFISSTQCTLGIDVSSAVSQSDFSCMLNDGYQFAVVRAWKSSCSVDANAANTIINALNAGFQHVDIYIFPSYSCSMSATAQVNAALDNLSSNGAKFGMAWIDIETGGGNSSPDAAMAWLNEALAAVVARGVNPGVYSSTYEWSQVMGSQNGPTQYPIWYAHYDNSASFNDWNNGIAFGGWSSPAIKQYRGDVRVCGAGVDVNFY